MKTHYSALNDGTTACKRKALRFSDDVYRVDCLSCKDTAVFEIASQVAHTKREEAFNAQVPRTVVPQFGRVNDDGVMGCPTCTGTLWRERPRSLFSYHYVCAECGNSVHPLTETGMCT